MKCAACYGTRHVPDPATGLWVPCRCLIVEREKQKVQATGFPPEIQSLTSAHLPKTQWAQALKAFLSHLQLQLREDKWPSTMLAISGRDERNRLHSGFLTAKVCLQANKTPKLLTVSSIFEFLFSDAKTTRPIIDPDLLIIDMGYEITNPKTETVIIATIRDRKALSKYTVLLTPDSQAHLRTRYGEELYRLIIDKERTQWLAIGSER